MLELAYIHRFYGTGPGAEGATYSPFGVIEAAIALWNSNMDDRHVVHEKTAGYKPAPSFRTHHDEELDERFGSYPG